MAKVPQFGSDWSRKMKDWLIQQIAEDDLPPEEAWIFIERHWEDILESWGDVNKLDRPVGMGVEVMKTVCDVDPDTLEEMKSILQEEADLWAEQTKDAWAENMTEDPPDFERKDAPDHEVPNIDSIDDPEELRDLADTYQLLANYCEMKAGACQGRKNGHVDAAMKFEHIMDGIYSTLPEWAKW